MLSFVSFNSSPLLHSPIKATPNPERTRSAMVPGPPLADDLRQKNRLVCKTHYSSSDTDDLLYNRQTIHLQPRLSEFDFFG